MLGLCVTTVKKWWLPVVSYLRISGDNRLERSDPCIGRKLIALVAES